MGEEVIHYHGTPMGGPRQDAIRFLRGRHALVSMAHPEDMGAVADACQSFVLDNGAFSVWKSGGILQVDAYMQWVEEWHRHPGFDWALIPDVIEGTEEENDALLAKWPSHLRGVPVWHLHESLDRLSRLAQKWPTVALGSSGAWSTPNSVAWWSRMTVVMEHLCDEHGRPPCRLHGLRMLDPEVFSRLPLASADSTNAAVNSGSLSRFGIYLPPTASQRAAVIADRIESVNSAAVFQRTHQKDLFS